MHDRAISVTVSLKPVELEALDGFAHTRQLTRSSAFRELMHKAGLIKIEHDDEERPKACLHPRDSIIKDPKGGFRCEDCGATQIDHGQSWSTP